MANFKNLTYHNTLNIPKSPVTFAVTGLTVLDDSYNDNFSGPIVKWNEMISDVTRTFDNGLNVALDGPNYLYSLESIDPCNTSYRFDMEFSATLSPQNLTADPIVVELAVGDGIKVRANFSSTDSWGELYLDDGVTFINETIRFEWSDPDFTFRILHTTLNVVSLFYKKNGKYYHILDRTQFADMASLPSYILSVSGVAASQGSLRFNYFKQFPICRGMEDARYIGGPLCDSYDVARQEALFIVHPMNPGQYSSIEVLSQNYSNDVDVIDETVTVMNHLLSYDDAMLLVGLPEKYYTDADLFYACPPFGVEEPQSRGSIEVINKCFDDGSALDDEKTFIEFPSSGLIDSSDKKKQVKFNLNIDGKRYGQDFDFKMIHKPDPSFIPPSDRPWRTMRILDLADGRRLYYGVIEDNRVPREVYFNWKIDATDTDVGYALYSMQDPTEPIDQARFEDGVNTYNVATDGLQRYFLPVGRYFFKCSKIFTNSTHEISVALDDASNKIVQFIDEKDELSNYTNVKIYFENRDPYGYLGYVFYDPATGDTSPFFVLEDAEVRTDTESVAAIQLEDGKVVLMFNRMLTDSGLQSYKSSDIYYRIVETSAINLGDYSAIKKLDLPRLYGSGTSVHAFDCCKTGDLVNLFVSFESHEQGFDSPVRDSSSDTATFVRNWAPFVRRGVDVFNFDANSVLWDRDNAFLRNYTTSSLKMQSLEYMFTGISEGNFGERFFEWTIADAPIPLWPDVAPLPPSFDNINYRESYLSADRIRCQANLEAGVVVVSILDMHLRKPTVFMGARLRYKEIAVPPFFDLATAEDKMRAAWLTSFESILHSDGMIYSIASTIAVDKYGADTSQLAPCEMAVIDPSIYDAPQQFFAIKNPNASVYGGIYGGVTIYEPEYRMAIIPFMTTFTGLDTPDFEKWNGASYDSLGTPVIQYADMANRVSIHRDRNFIIMIQAMNRYKVPLIAQTCYSNFPQETICIEYFPADADSSSDVDRSGTTSVSAQAWGIRNTSAESYIQRRLNYNNMIKDYHVSGDLGYRAVATMKLEVDGGLLLTNAIMSVDFITGEALGQSLTPALDFKRMRARFLLNESTAICQYYNVDTSAWTTAGTIAISTDVVYDFHIYAHNYDFDRLGFEAYDLESDRARFVWMIKTNRHANDPAYYGFINEVVGVVKASEIKIDKTYTTEQSAIRLSFAGNGSGALNDYLRVYGFGWGLIRTDVFPRRFVSTTKDGVPVYEYLDVSSDGKSWRQWDDRELFTKSPNDSIYPVRLSSSYLDNVSMSSYGGNGFSFTVTGASLPSDLHYLQRYLTSDIDSLSSKRLHGVWIANEPSNDVYIWSDAADSGMDFFDADTFVLIGHNFYLFDIVGKNSLSDPWITLAEVFPASMRMDSAASAVLNDKIYFVQSGLNITEGAYREEEVRFFESSLGNIPTSLLKDEGVYVNSIYVVGPDAKHIYIPRYVKRLEEIARYRFLGIRIKAQEIAEGYLKLNSLDFGIASRYPLSMEPELGNALSVDSSASLKYIEDTQAYSFKVKKPTNSFNFNYYAINAADFVRIMSAMDEVDVRRKPIYVISNYENDKNSVYLCLASDVTNEVIVDDNQETYYKLSISFNGV